MSINLRSPGVKTVPRSTHLHARSVPAISEGSRSACPSDLRPSHGHGTPNAPSGIRTRATTLKGWRPGPLVDGGGRARIPAAGATIRGRRAVSSVGRAPALHAGGRRFESCTAHSHSERHAGSAQPHDSFHAISAEIAVPCRPRPLETGHWRMRMFVLRTISWGSLQVGRCP